MALCCVPAPASFSDLRVFLHQRSVDAEYLCHVLEQYLAQPENRPVDDVLSDAGDVHHAWAYRAVLADFIDAVRPRADPDATVTALPATS